MDWRSKLTLLIYLVIRGIIGAIAAVLNMVIEVFKFFIPKR